jgi:hypothetical protein
MVELEVDISPTLVVEDLLEMVEELVEMVLQLHHQPVEDLVAVEVLEVGLEMEVMVVVEVMVAMLLLIQEEVVEAAPVVVLETMLEAVVELDC